MKNLVNRWFHIMGTAALTLWCCLAQAEDIEVYRGSDSGLRSSAMIVMDTSGSMSRWVLQNTPEYDSNINYSAQYAKDEDGNDIDYPFDSTLYYFSNQYSGGELSDSNINDLEDRPFPPAALVCSDAIEAMQNEGTYSNKFKRWNTSTQIWDPSTGTNGWVWTSNGWRWRAISPDTPTGSSSDTSAIIECKSDENIDPTGKYVNTVPSNSNKYRNSKANNYNDTWNNNFRYIFHGNYLNYQVYITKFVIEHKESRMQVTRGAVKHVLNTTGDIKIGLARFNTFGNGGLIDIPIANIEDVRQEFADTIDTYLPWYGTPLSEAYYETARYLRGDTVFYGTNSEIRLQKSGTTLIRDNDGFINYSTNNSRTYTQSDPSVSSSRSGSTYASPITSACQNTTGVVLFTDGVPSSSDDSANSNIRSLLTNAQINFSTISHLTDEDREVLSNSCSGGGNCAEELAYYLANVDQRPDLPGLQTIVTHVIGGFFDESSQGSALKYMEDIAKYGKGTYTTATNKEEIVAAFQAAAAAISDNPVTFVAPAVAANAYNSLEHLDDLYYAMFTPSADNNWAGNLKSYRLSPEGLVVDAAGDIAIGSAGLFKDTSRSYWTDASISDGGDVIVGGAAANFTQDNTVFTHLSDNKGNLTTKPSIDNVTKSMLGLDSTASSVEHLALIDWINRKDGLYTRTQMEDPLHSRPIVVNYSYSKDPDNGRVTSEGVVFVGTNSGYLHAFKADKHEFKEYFSFIPKELLANANLYRTKDKSQPKAYGVDGPINYWHEDVNQNSKVDNGEKVFLYFGLRRGGRHYYALDISNPDAPKFQWKISGGIGGDFDKMGESWSQMSLAKVRWEGKTKVVLLFGGGYDADEDNRTSRAPNSMGNSVYMIDPESGDLLWSASNSDATTNLLNMTNSITSEVKTVDFDGDSITDYFYVSDIGGRIWRFDINKETTGKSDFIEGAGILFDANKNNPDYQRFFYAPSVSYFAEKTGDKYLTVSIGSGFRAHPLQADSEDSFYIIKDYNIVNTPVSYNLLQRSDLEYLFDSPTAPPMNVLGWKYDLSGGQKILATPLTAGGNMYFTTFAPAISAPNPNTCNADIGSSIAYSVDFLGDDQITTGTGGTGTGGTGTGGTGTGGTGTGGTGTGGAGATSGPVIKSVPLPNIGIAPQVIEVRTSKAGQVAFCESNPSHKSCQPDECELTNSCPDKCEDAGSVIISGTNSLGAGVTRCELVKKDYWRSL
jgi:type IV pilus assembly protein PilY1